MNRILLPPFRSRRAALALVVVVVLGVLSGCAATVQRGDAPTGAAADVAPVQIPAGAASKLVLNVGGSPRAVGANDWDAFRLEWKEGFAQQAKLAGIAFEMQEGVPRATGQDGTLLYVDVDDYRFMRPGVRYVVGVLGGNAYIVSKLNYRSLRTGDPFGTQLANTSSSAWQGVFSAVTNKQVEAIAADVFRQMKGGAKPAK